MGVLDLFNFRLYERPDRVGLFLMTMSSKKKLTACLVLADGSVFYGHGFGAKGIEVAELCFNQLVDNLSKLRVVALVKIISIVRKSVCHGV